MTWRRGAEAGSAALVFLLTWPLGTLTPAAGLDPSWQAGLHLAAQRGLDFGRDFTFTYGPLGFLGAPRLFFTSTAALGILYTVAVQVALCVTVVYFAHRLVPLALALLGSWVVVALALTEPAEIVPIVMAMWCVWAVGAGRAREDDTPPWWPWLVGTAVAAIQLLLKFNTGLVCGALVAVSAALVYPRVWRLLAAMAAEFAVLVTGLWLLTGGPLGHLPAFLRDSLDMTSGYSEAMALEESARQWEYVAAIVLVAGTVAAVVIAARLGARRYPAVPLLVVFGLVAYLEFRRGFVRHDAHSIPFFLAGALVALAVPWPRAVIGLAVAAAWTVVLGFAVHLPLWTAVDPAPRVEALRSQTRLMVSSERRREAVLAAKDDVRRAVGLSPAVLAEIDGHTVHVDPWETSAIWAYGLSWRPEPVFQSYLAYSPVLDQENADLLESARAPERVLRHVPAQAIDGRHPFMDDPRSELALACNYHQTMVDGEWEVLAKGLDRCLPARPIATVAVKSGDSVAAPEVGADEILVMRVHLGRSLLGRLQAAVFKPASLDYVVLDGGRYRLVTANAGGPLPLCLPPALCPATVGIVHDGSIAISFAAIPLRAPA